MGVGTAALATVNQRPEQGDLRYVHDVLPRTCRPTKRLKSTGPYQSKTQQSLRGPWLLQSVAVIVSKPQLHENESSEDLAVAGNEPLPPFFCALSCLLHVENEHGKILRKCSSGDTSMVTKPSPLSSWTTDHHFPKSFLQCFLVQVSNRSLLKIHT